MKRFLLFAGDRYYPWGGWRDFRGSFDNLNDARNHICLIKPDWAHVFDTETNEIIHVLGWDVVI